MEAIELLRKLISVNSIYPKETELAELLEQYLRNIGFSTERQYVSANRFNIFAQRGEGDRSILFYGHMDTVPIYGKWKNNPFELITEGDRLRGLGAWDMKSGIAGVLKAVEECKNRKIKIIFGVDEENISEGAFQAIKKKEFFEDVEGVIVTEAGNSEKGSLGTKMITLGRRGRCVYLIEIEGTSAHGATNKGENAILSAAKIIQFLESQNLKEHPHLPRANQFVRKVHSEVEGVSIPDKAIIELDRHLVPPETNSSVLKELVEQMKQFENDKLRINVSIKERKTPYLEPYITDRNNSFVEKIAEIIKNKYGEVNYNYALSVADENAFASLGLPVVTMGPTGEGDHSSEEWVSKESYLELIEVLKEIIE
ncbi:MAG: M20/M25/M40 family metallo-hydrolase [Candidatus ainarchaeum sp.]|nr:M20/M25/M40 family metallo-hydrolase [Candidatus ainarchaeum sp.]